LTKKLHCLRVLASHPNKLIAHDLLVSAATVSEHLKTALATLNLRSIADLRELLTVSE